MMRAVGTIALCGVALATATPALAETAPKSTLKIVVVVDDLPKGATLTLTPTAAATPPPPRPATCCGRSRATRAS